MSGVEKALAFFAAACVLIAMWGIAFDAISTESAYVALGVGVVAIVVFALMGRNKRKKK